MKTVAIVGASGAVGREVLSLLQERNFPADSIRIFASATSAGKKIGSLTLEPLSDLSEIDLVFFCAGSLISKEWIPQCKGFVIDLSSAFRMDAKVPLIIPEINPEAMKLHHRVIASPNCAATILLMPLFPLHRLYKVKRIVASTYQAASGAGNKLVEQLKNETRAHLEKTDHPLLFPFPYAFNLYPHNSELHPSGYVDEELKMVEETRKILEDHNIQLSATCVRVPVLRAHSIAANVEFHRPPSLDEIKEVWKKTAGIRLFEDPENNRFATPHDATGIDEVLCGRLRMDLSQPHTIEFWAVGDQLRKGAALNAVQIAERWI